METLNLPPFPPLAWDDCYWTCDTVLPSWDGFQSRLGPYGGIILNNPSYGGVRVLVACADVEEQAPPLPEQVAAFQHLLENETRVSAAVLSAIFDSYQRARDIYWDNEDKMPEISRPEDLKSLIGLSNLHVLDVVLDGCAYVGFEFGCTWDQHRDLGVLMHRGRVVRVGEGNTAYQEWLADEDAEEQRVSHPVYV